MLLNMMNTMMTVWFSKLTNDDDDIWVRERGVLPQACAQLRKKKKLGQLDKKCKNTRHDSDVNNYCDDCDE